MTRLDPRPGPLLGGRSPAAFLRRYWQKRPLLVRGALPGFRDPIRPEELLSLASAADVESRLVLTRGGARPYTLVEGPQDPARLGRLPPKHWTLLVQGVDRLAPRVARLRERFRFVPDWRIDDVMVSFASPFGSVGPHLDSYDVFLIQGQGRRRWRLQLRPDPALRPGLDLRVLRRFAPDAEWVLEPGDMLYVPPGVAHHGVALEPSLTYSIGFRVPSSAELVAALVERRLRGASAGRGYADPDLRPARQAGEIDRAAFDRLRVLLARELEALAGPGFERAVGELLTEAKDTGPEPRRRPLTSASLRRHLTGGAALLRNPSSRIAFIRRGSGTLLFVDGQTIPLPRPLRFAGPFLTSSSRLEAGEIRAHLRAPGFLPLLLDLVNRGAFALGRR